MDLSSLFKTHSPSDICLILDIGTVSVSAALVRYQKGVLPEILYSHSIPLSITEHPHMEHMQSTLLSACKEVLSHTFSYGMSHSYFAKNTRKINQVLCVFSSPWYASKTKTVSITNNKPFVITPTFISHLIQVEVSQFEKELSEGVHGDQFTHDTTLLSTNIIDTKINGYSLNTPLHKKTTQCDITLYIGIGSQSMVDALQTLILDTCTIQKNHIAFHTFPLISHSATHQIFPHTHSYILCHITGEITDITCIAHRTISETSTFPSGTFFVIRKVAEAFSVSPDIAQSYLHMYTTQKAGPSMTQKIEKVLIDVEHEWSIYFEDVFNTLQTQNTVPDTIYVVTDPLLAPLFISFLKNEKADITASWRKQASILHISKDILSHHITSTSHSPVDESLALEAVFLSLIHGLSVA